MKNTKVLFMGNNVSGVQYWRMYGFFLKMREKGLDAAYFGWDKNINTVGQWELNFEKDIKLREIIYSLISTSNIVVFQYIHSPVTLALIYLALRLKKKVLCEIDDYILETPSYNPAYSGGCHQGSPIEKVIIEQFKCSDMIITSTDYLKSKYKQFNKHIEVVPNSIDFKFWDNKNSNDKNKKVKIGWIGGGNHEEDLRVCLDFIPVLLNKYKNIEFLFTHGVPGYLKKLDKRVSWNNNWAYINDYPKLVAKQGYDIGIAPLEINSFNMSKSNIRYMEYATLKVPCVATNIEPYKKSIKDNYNGFLAENVGEWIEKLSCLIEDKALREGMGLSAYDNIFENNNIEQTVDKYIKILRGI